MSLADTRTLRILVVGDSGVGKTSLVKLLATGKAQPASQWTVGCSQELMATHYSGGGGRSEYFVEFWDVGGSKKYSASRSVFYTGINGIMLVYDRSNRKSYANLRKWIRELVEADEACGGMEPDAGSSSYGPIGVDRRGARHRTRSRGSNVEDDSRDGSLLSGPSSGAGAGAGAGSGGGMGAPRSGSGWFNRRPKPSYSAAEKRLGELPIIIVANKCDLAAGHGPARDSMHDYGIESVDVSSLHDNLQSNRLSAFFESVYKRAVAREEGIVPRGAGGALHRRGAGPRSDTPGAAMGASLCTPTRLIAPAHGGGVANTPVSASSNSPFVVITS